MSGTTAVGIAGGSGAGKTTVMERIANAIGSTQIVTLCLDNYYRDLQYLTPETRATFNFDEPAAFDVSTFVAHLKALKTGKPIPCISYDYASLMSHTASHAVAPRPVIIVEGIFVLAIPAIRELLDIKVFVDTDADLRFIRRCRRDILAHGRTFPEIASQYEHNVRDMHNQLVEPSRDFADLVLPLDRPNESGIEFIIRSLASLVTRQPPRLITSPADGADLILIPHGNFTMGTNDVQIDQMRKEYNAQIQWFNDERPAHQVTVDSFYIDKFPVTNRQYRKFVDATRHRAPATWHASRFGNSEYPVTGVSWEDAHAYAAWAGKRLLTEAEWEKAARGINARLYPWGNAAPEGRANYGGKYGGPTVVTKFPDGASPYGVMDLAGNVWEWVQDWYDRDYYSNSPASNPTGPPYGVGRGVRGGSWVNNATMLRCAERDRRRLPHEELKHFGFRCALDVERGGV